MPPESDFTALQSFMSSKIPYWQTLGLQLKEVSPGKAVFEAQVRPDLLQNGILHGGVLASIADSACAVAAISKVVTREKGFAYIRWHAAAVERFALLCEVDLVRQAKAPSVRQRAIQYIGKHTLRVQADSRDVRLAPQQRHREVLRSERPVNDVFHRLRPIHDLLAAHLLVGLANGSDQGRWFSCGPHDYRGSRRRHLYEILRHLHAGKVELFAQGLSAVRIETPLLYMANYAHNLCQSIRAPKMDSFADGFLPGKKLMREGLIRDGDQRRVFIILSSEETPFP